MKLHFIKYAKTAMNHFNLGKILDNCDNIIQSKVTLDFKIRIEDNDNQGRLAKATLQLFSIR
jgi:hypothetical protein